MNEIRSAPWSQVQATPLARIARKVIDEDSSHLAYHNSDHVVSMYEYLDDTNEPYDEALDWAILFHDIVYDEKPEKELRSAKLFIDMISGYDGCNLRPAEQGRVYSLIMRTVDHVVMPEVKGSSAIVRADLHGLTKTLTAFQNFGKIMKESMSLYDIDEVEFSKNSERFMTALLHRMSGNVSVDPDHTVFYFMVSEGIFTTIKLAQLIQGTLK